MQTHTPPSDGDDENDEVEEGVSTILEEDADIAEGDSVEAEATPKRLRSGKVVGDEVTSGDDEVTSGDDEGNEVEGDEEDQILEDDASAIVEDEDVEGAEEEVEVAEDEGEDDTENG
jgi:mitogen-activated protein kinase kinase kinase 13